MRPRRIEVEVGSLLLDDPAQVHLNEIMVAVERELARLVAAESLREDLRRPAGGRAAQNRSAATVGEAIARSVAEELPR